MAEVFYHSTSPTRVNGSGYPFEEDVNGNLLTSLGTSLNKTDDEVMVYPHGTVYTQITSSTAVVSGAGQLVGIFVSAAAAAPTITVYDNTGGSGTKLLDTFTPVAATFYSIPNAKFATGCYVTIANTVSCTVFTQ